MATSRALIVFARAPRLGRVKTRLAAQIGARAATDTYRRLLWRTIAFSECADCSQRYLYCAGGDEKDYFQTRLDAALWRVRVQCPGDIGVRMCAAMAEALSGHDIAVLIGTDVADASAADLDAALAALDKHEAAISIGPTSDGGYWLIGLRQLVPALFTDIPWSTAAVYETTRQRLRHLGLTVSSLALRHDVDEMGDLNRRAHTLDRT